jgi:outer membrane lipoprotein-sorting protein
MRPSYFTLLLMGLNLFWQARVTAQTPSAGVPAVASSKKLVASREQPDHFFAYCIVAETQEPTPPSLSTTSTVVTSTNPTAQALLDAAIKALTKPEGVDVQFVQTILSRTQPVTMTGRSVSAAGRKSFVELNYQQVKRQASLKLLCDGETFHRLEKLPEANSRITYSMKELQEALDKLASNEAERVAKEDVEKQQQGIHGFEGIAAQLKDLSKRMFFTAPTETTLEIAGKGKQAVKMIEGTWTPAMLDLFAPNKKTSDPNQQDYRYLYNEKLYFFQLPRTARIYFDASTGQFLRMELLGILERKGTDQVLTSFQVTSLSFPSSLDDKLFKASEEELKYPALPIDLAVSIKNRHTATMDMLKMQQQMQNEVK